MKNLKISRLFDNKTFCKVFSIIGAVIIWASITLTNQTDSESTLKNVPINFSVSGTFVEALGLTAFDRSADTVSIRLSGRRANLNATSVDDFDVTLSLGNITAAGKQTVQIDVKLKETAKEVTIVDFSPKKIEVNFDRTASKTLTIDTDTSKLSAEDGFLLDKGYPSSQEISIIGPESVVKTITKCVAQIDTKKTVLSETLNVSKVPIVLYDENNNVVSNNNVTVDKETVDVSVPVLKIKSLPMVVHFINTPSSFDNNAFRYQLSETKIEVAGPESTIDSMTQLDIGYADLKAIKPGDSVSMPIELPSGFVNVDNINEIQLTIPADNLSEKKYTVKTFNVIGVPENKNVKVVTKQLSNVILVGNTELVNSITESDIVVEVNLSGTTIQSGTTTVPATITIPGKSGVFWIFGNYEVVIKSN